MKDVCVIDGRKDNRLNDSLMTLLLGGMMVIEYPIRAALQSGIFSKVYVMTDIDYLSSRLANVEGIEVVDCISDMESDKFGFRRIWIISGRVPFITADTLKRCAKQCISSSGYSVVQKYNVDFDFKKHVSFLAGGVGGGASQCSFHSFIERKKYDANIFG